MTFILRRTEKLAELLPVTDLVPAASDTALGDWYINRQTVDRKPLLMLVSADTLLPIVIPARGVRTLPQRLGALVRHRLQLMDIPTAWIDAEVAAMATVAVAKTASRSVLGVMNEFMYTVPYYLESGWNEDSLDMVGHRLADMPIFASGPASRVLYPRDATPQRLRERWEPEA